MTEHTNGIATEAHKSACRHWKSIAMRYLNERGYAGTKPAHKYELWNGKGIRSNPDAPAVSFRFSECVPQLPTNLIEDLFDYLEQHDEINVPVKLSVTKKVIKFLFRGEEFEGEDEGEVSANVPRLTMEDLIGEPIDEPARPAPQPLPPVAPITQRPPLVAPPKRLNPFDLLG